MDLQSPSVGGVCFSFIPHSLGSWMDVGISCWTLHHGWSSSFSPNARLQLQRASLQVDKPTWFSLNDQSFCCLFIFGPVASLLLCQLHDAFRNRILCFILTPGCCCQECSSVCLAGHTAGNSSSHSALLVVLRWLRVAFLLLLPMSSDGPVFLLTFPALIVPSHLPWV